MLFPPLGAATLAAQLRRLGIETRVFDCTFGTFEQLRADLAAYRPDIVGIYSMVSLTAQHAARRGDGPDEPAAGPARRRRAAAHRVPGPLHAALRRRVPRRGRRELPSLLPRLLRAGGVPAADLGELPLATYGGLFVADHGLHVDNPTVHHRRERDGLVPSAGQERLRPCRLSEGVAARRPGRRPPRSSPRWAARSAATSAPSRSSAASSAGATSTRCSRRSSRSAALGYDSLWIADDTFTLNAGLPRGVLPAHRRRWA